jgi:16S rRNA (adenine1518-N6/adenine1519-N6)-dimethyltransferase
VHRAKKSLGQNFLVDPNIQQKIVEAVQPQPHDEVLEIGPGTGALTRRIAGHVRRLTAVELDDHLARSLQDEFADRADVVVLHRDALRLDLRDVTERTAQLKVVGNIPYNITSPLIFKLLEREHRPADIVLMIQREVAERIVAPPGDKEYGALSVGVRAVADAQRLFHVGRGAFRPTPRVDSVVIRITPHRPEPLTAGEEEDLRSLTRAAFGWRRKQLQKILRSSPTYALDAAEIAALSHETGIDLEARPEQLTPHQFIALSRALRLRRLPASAVESLALPRAARAEEP